MKQPQYECNVKEFIVEKIHEIREELKTESTWNENENYKNLVHIRTKQDGE